METAGNRKGRSKRPGVADQRGVNFYCEINVLTLLWVIRVWSLSTDLMFTVLLPSPHSEAWLTYNATRFEIFTTASLRHLSATCYVGTQAIFKATAEQSGMLSAGGVLCLSFSGTTLRSSLCTWLCYRIQDCQQSSWMLRLDSLGVVPRCNFMIALYCATNYD